MKVERAAGLADLRHRAIEAILICVGRGNGISLAIVKGPRLLFTGGQ